jgi:hypothetical protein
MNSSSDTAKLAAPDEIRARIRSDHRGQRELFDRVIAELDGTTVGSKLVVGVRELSRAIRDDMEYEERELLDRP